jgi:hypothetical protein
MNDDAIPQLDPWPAGIQVLPGSVTSFVGGQAALTASWEFAVQSPEHSILAGLEGRIGDGRLVGPTSPRNAAALRRLVPALRPRPLGLATSAGFGDRLGLATPGHVRALRAAGGSILPVFAQQSVRENSRTGRTPIEVLDAATWGVLAEGWHGSWGADADHLKTLDDIDAFAVAGFTTYTLDPGESVIVAADRMDVATLQREARTRIPWDEMDDDLDRMLARYRERPIVLESGPLPFTEEDVLRAAVKYGGAVAQIRRMAAHLEQAVSWPVEIEIAVDETESPTTPFEHAWMALELRRLGISWVGMAPCFRGRFEKGIDFIGDAADFEADFALQAEVARSLGPYKISVHSGSDKFSVYDAIVRRTGSLVHLKTSGTSYLEALRTVADLDIPLFARMYDLAREGFAANQASYHLSTDLAKAPPVDAAGIALLDNPDARQILHVAYGPILHEYGSRIRELLTAHREDYAANLQRHFERHLRPFALQAQSRAE